MLGDRTKNIMDAIVGISGIDAVRDQSDRSYSNQILKSTMVQIFSVDRGNNSPRL